MTGMEVLITEIMGSRCPIEPQVEGKYWQKTKDWKPQGLKAFFCSYFLLFSQICRILENDCVGFTVTNRGGSELLVEKEGQEVAMVSVMVRTDLDHRHHRR